MKRYQLVKIQSFINSTFVFVCLIHGVREEGFVKKVASRACAGYVGETLNHRNRSQSADKRERERERASEPSMAWPLRPLSRREGEREKKGRLIHF